MSNHRYSSKHFNQVPSSIDTQEPLGCLLHEGVRKAGEDVFSSTRKHEVHVIDLPTRALSMTFGALKPLQGSGLHRHNDGTIIYVISGAGFSMIGQTRVAWTAGDAIYIPVWQWHTHVNTSDTEEATYIAC